VIAGRYRVAAEIGQGGMGSVFLAQDQRLGKDVALKVLPRDLWRNANAVKRFRTEARAASLLNHPNTVRVIDFNQEPDGLLFLVMEYLKGVPLSLVLEREGAFAGERVTVLAGQLLGALSDAHGHGVVHRDVKPKNVMHRKEPGVGEFVKMVDFGIAKIVLDTDDPTVTVSGTALGTPAYMSPEQAQSMTADHRSDLYSLGVLLYELLTDRLPFEGETPFLVMCAHRDQPVPPLPEKVRDQTPPALVRLVYQLLQKRPDQRPSSAEAALRLLAPSAPAPVSDRRIVPRILRGPAGDPVPQDAHAYPAEQTAKVPESVIEGSGPGSLPGGGGSLREPPPAGPWWRGYRSVWTWATGPVLVAIGLLVYSLGSPTSQEPSRSEPAVRAQPGEDLPAPQVASSAPALVPDPGPIPDVPVPPTVAAPVRSPRPDVTKAVRVGPPARKTLDPKREPKARKTRIPVFD
jgi:serine/threonine protein kinase